MKLSTLALIVTAATVTASSSFAAPAGWDAYIIRGAPVINENYGGNPQSVQLIVNGSGLGGSDKAGLGSNALNGATIGQIDSLFISRDDNYTRFVTESGPYVAPYMNIWVKDANGRVAVLANEPSNAGEWTGTSEWNTSGSNLLTKSVKVFETEAGFVLPAGVTLDTSNGLTNANFSAFAGYEITVPSTAYLAANEPTGSGAPREILTNAAYGFNWIFGDTGGNYDSDLVGFVVSSPAVSAVPEPTTLAALGAASVLGLRRRRA